MQQLTKGEDHEATLAIFGVDVESYSNASIDVEEYDVPLEGASGSTDRCCYSSRE